MSSIHATHNDEEMNARERQRTPHGHSRDRSRSDGTVSEFRADVGPPFTWVELVQHLQVVVWLCLWLGRCIEGILLLHLLLPAILSLLHLLRRLDAHGPERELQTRHACAF